jgi:hypothetical protein
MTQPNIFDDDAPWAEWLPELRMLLEAYAAVPREERFTDTDETPSPAMRAYLRIATYYPGRAYRATHEILDVLKYGLDEADVADNLASMPPIVAPPGRTREDCLIAMLPHLAAFTEDRERAEPAVPETTWEYRERLPNLAHLLGSYFHQDAEPPYEAVVDDYLAHTWDHQVAAAAREARELLSLCGAEEETAEGVRMLGAAVLPEPDAVRGWLDRLAGRLDAHLSAQGYRPHPTRDLAYPLHDLRSVVR